MSPPVAAAYPMIGGIAPTTAPERDEGDCHLNVVVYQNKVLKVDNKKKLPLEYICLEREVPEAHV